jgi:thiamine-monophosphate kinase
VALAADPKLLSVVLNGGDDYEVLATVLPGAADAFAAGAAAAGVPVTRIGEICSGKGIPVVRDAAGKVVRLVARSHTHF